jgi:hypothetical protein
VPIQEVVFDFGTLRVMANMALTGVALEAGPCWAQVAASGKLSILMLSLLSLSALSFVNFIGGSSYVPQPMLMQLERRRQLWKLRNLKVNEYRKPASEI